MPNTARRRPARALAALAAAAAVAGSVTLAAPAEAFTTRIETTSVGRGAREVVTLPHTATVAVGSTLRVTRAVPYASFRRLVLSAPGRENLELRTATAVPGTTTAWDVGLPGVTAGTYTAELEAVTDSGDETAAYVFTLAVTAGTPSTVAVPLVGGSTVRYAPFDRRDEWVLAGSRVTVVAPPSTSFRNATVRVGVPARPYSYDIPAPAPDDLAVTRVSSGTSLQFRVPASVAEGQPITRQTLFVVEITVPAQRTNNGVGRLVLRGRLDVDPLGTPWSPPPGVGSITTDHIHAGLALRRRDSLVSGNGRYRLAMQTNSNLVLWKGSTAIWQTGQLGAAWTELNNDGNLISRDASGAVVWQTARYGARGDAMLWLRDDGELLIVGEGLRTVWSAGTAGR